MTLDKILLAVASALIGIALRAIYEWIRARYRFKKELKDNSSIDVTGADWYAAWQTSVDNTILLNTERLKMVQKGNTVKLCNLERSPENPKGGYLWDSQMQFFYGRWMMGWYFALKSEQNTSRGIMFFTYHSAKKLFYGKWVGAAHDGDLCNGFLVISKERSLSLSELERIIALHPDKVNIVFTTL